MPVKLILILILVVFVAVLTGFNLSNVCTIWFFHSFENIPVIAAILGSFILGVLVTLPFTFIKKKSKSEKTEASGKTKKFGKASKEKKSSGESSGSAGEASVSDPDYVPAESKSDSEK